MDGRAGPARRRKLELEPPPAPVAIYDAAGRYVADMDPITRQKTPRAPQSPRVEKSQWAEFGAKGGRKGGSAGGRARWADVTPEDRSILMSKAVRQRWETTPPEERTRFAHSLLAARDAKRAHSASNPIRP
jgi:hypothetical protein